MSSILYSGGCGEITVKKSKFISESFVVNSVEEANEVLIDIRKKYWDATHNCYAYRINDLLKKCSDDGEPSKTAGYPILDVIDKKNIDNCLVVITRYFGGTLLGTGGLVKAYTDAAVACINNSVIAEKNIGYKTKIICSYEQYGEINHFINEEKIYVESTDFLEKVTINLYLYEDQRIKLEKKLQGIFRSEDVYDEIVEKKIIFVEGKMLEI